ncbi:homocitrate synthase/isopropylmalate synthase family protein [Paenibacillus sp. URB8-2]|uniref:homocitrate synthase/isopropylmalate synthase family protein n=1 Tax=Paenibacillus sp. URB8-2 TaxID=2741301 RepID=UPI0015B8C7FA|nr:pyruvate carboxyltransferase [Paenibacillus sp. URB8-2]BCG58812.1 homocitrate synthase [Paenibacillus sp. URB8-2]
MIELIDYTVDEAFRRSVDLEEIGRMAAILQRYGLTVLDVYIRHIHSYRRVIADTDLTDRIRVRVRPTADDLSLARSMGFTKVAILWSNTLDRMSLFKLEAALRTAKEFAHEIYLYVEDLTLTHSARFDAYWPLVERYGIKRLIYCDSKSRLDPLIARSTLTELMKRATCPLEFCGANVLGLATANSLAALKAGVEHIGISVAGVGSKGKAAMEEVLMAVKVLWKQTEGPSTDTLADDCEAVLSAMNIPVAVNKAVIGQNVFAHESGIHVDGISKNPELYEVIRPEEMGLARKLFIGKHSGTSSLKRKFGEWDMGLASDEAVLLLEQVRELAEYRKRPINDIELMELYKRQSDFQ